MPCVTGPLPDQMFSAHSATRSLLVDAASSAEPPACRHGGVHDCHLPSALRRAPETTVRSLFTIHPAPGANVNCWFGTGPPPAGIAMVSRVQWERSDGDDHNANPGGLLD